MGADENLFTVLLKGLLCYACLYVYLTCMTSLVSRDAAGEYGPTCTTLYHFCQASNYYLPTQNPLTHNKPR